MTGRQEEGQSRRIVWEVCPVKRLLLSVAMITKAGNQVFLGEDKAFVKNNKTVQITSLRRERNVWMLDLWVKRQGRISSLLGRGQGLRQEQQDGADHKPSSRAERVDA